MSFNTAQIKDRAREVGRTISDQEAQQIMNATGGGDEGQVMAYLQGGGSGDSGGGDTASALIQASIDKYTQMLDVYTKKYKEFDVANPFIFDDILAEEMKIAGGRLDPYYQQTLGDFLTGINRTRQRGREDATNLLTELNQDINDYTGETKLGLQRAIDKTREGYADIGLYGSGEQLAAEGYTTARVGDETQQYLNRQDVRKQGIQRSQDRLVSDLSLEENLRRRDLGREQSYETRTQALDEVERRQRQREFEKAQYTGVPPGVSPQQYSGYTLGLLG